MKFKYGDRVTIINTNSFLDGYIGEICGVSAVGYMLTIYIVRLVAPDRTITTDDFEADSITMPECCLVLC